MVKVLNCKTKKEGNMLKFIKYYALEIYTVLSMFILMSAGIIGDLSMIQKFTLVYIFLFILHEWNA